MKLFDNLGFKIFSVVLAAVLWLIVTSSQARAGVFPGKIPVSFSNLPSNLIAISDTSTIQIKVVAEPGIWSKLTANSFKATANLSNLKAGTHSVEINVTSLVSEARVVERNPSSLLVRIEPTITKKLPINVKTVGEPKEGLAVTQATASPDQVEATGPESLISQLDEASATVVLHKESQRQSVTSKVEVYNSQGQPIPDISFNPKEVTVNVRFGRAATAKSVGIKVLTTGTLPVGLQISEITVEPNVVTINGTTEALANIKILSTKPIDLSKISESSVIESDFDLPEGVNLVDTDNKAKIRFKIDKITPAETTQT